MKDKGKKRKRRSDKKGGEKEVQVKKEWGKRERENTKEKTWGKTHGKRYRNTHKKR